MLAGVLGVCGAYLVLPGQLIVNATIGACDVC